MRKTTVVFAFILLILSPSARTEEKRMEKAASGIGIFDEVYAYVGADDRLLSATEYVVTYSSSQDIYTVHTVPEFDVWIQKKITGSNFFSAKIVLSEATGEVYTINAGIQEFEQYAEIFNIRTQIAFFNSCYFGYDKIKKTTAFISDANENWSVPYNYRPFSDTNRQEIHYRIINYDDLQQIVYEWSDNGKEWTGEHFPVAMQPEQEAFIFLSSTVPTCFRLEDVKIEPITFPYGQRIVERIDEHSARVTLEITNPALQPNKFVLEECIEGDLSVTHISHGGTVEEATGTINRQQLGWILPAVSGKTRLEYTIQAKPPAVYALALFRGSVQDKLIVGTGEYTFVSPEDKLEDFQHWRTWTAVDGLPDTKVRYLNWAPSGSLYVVNFNSRTATSHLNRFDGYEFYPIPLAEELKEGFVKEGLDGSLWFYQNWNLYRQQEDESGAITWEMCKTTADQPLQVTDQQTLAFLHCGNPEVGGNTAKYKFVPVDAEHIYCLTRKQLKLYNADTREETVLLEADSTPLGTFEHMILSQDLNLWITGERGAIKVDVQKRNCPIITKYTIPEDSSLGDFREPIEGMDGSLLVEAGHSFVTSKQYLVVLDQKIQPRAMEHGSPISYADKSNIWMLGSHVGESENEYILNCKPDGRRVLPPGKDRITYRTGDFDNEGNGSFWLGSDYGLLRHSPPLWRKPEAIKDIQTEISTITEDAAGNIWMLEEKHLIKFDGQVWKKYPKPHGLTYWSCKTQALVCLPDGRVAINNGDSHLTPKPFCIFNPQSETFEFVYHPNKLHCDYIAQGKHRNLLAVTYDEARVAQIDAYENNEFIKLVDPQEQVRMGIFNICELDNGDILIGSDHNDHLQWFRDGKRHLLMGHSYYPGFTALSILEVEPNKIWVGDNNELYEFNGERWSVIRTNLNNVMSMIKARDGSIWVASWTGLHRYKDGYWVTHNSQDGFRYDMVNKIFEDSQGRLWAGTSDGVYLYHPEADPDPPQTYIPEKENLNDFASKGEVRINFIGIDRWKYTEQDRLLYSYRLNQGEWSAYDISNVATFANMPPDDYTIEVRSMDRNWNIDLTPASFSFRVNHVPIQERAWFIPAVVATLSLILLLAIYAIVSRFQLAEFARNLESMVETRTRELSTTQRHLLNISEHEQQRIGQDLHDDVVQELVGIALNSEVLLKQLRQRAPEVIQELEKILGKVDEATLKTRRLARGLAPVNLDKLGLVSALQTLCSGISHFYGIECTLQAPDGLKLENNEQRLNLFRIAQEAAHNAIKHVRAQHIAISLAVQDNQVTLRVDDDGEGFEPEEHSEGMGLQIMRYRALSLNGNLQIHSRKGEGTSVICVFPLGAS